MERRATLSMSGPATLVSTTGTSETQSSMAPRLNSSSPFTLQTFTSIWPRTEAR